MDVVSVIVAILSTLGVVLFAGSYVARRQSETNARLRRLEARVDQLLDHAELKPAAEEMTEVNELIASGQRTRAVKAFRETTGADLVTATNAVERIERGQ